MNYNCNLNFDMALLSTFDWRRMYVLRKCCHMQTPPPCGPLPRFHSRYLNSMSLFMLFSHLFSRKDNKNAGTRNGGCGLFRSQQWRIHDFPDGVRQLTRWEACQPFFLPNFWRKLHENEGARPWHPFGSATVLPTHVKNMEYITHFYSFYS